MDNFEKAFALIADIIGILDDIILTEAQKAVEALSTPTDERRED